MSAVNKAMRISHIINHLHTNSTTSKFTSQLTFTLITGCNRGLGYALVEHLLTNRANYFVIASCRNINNAQNLKSLIHKFPGRSMLIQLDTASKQSIEQSIKNVLQITNRLDILINNAGIGTSNFPWETVLDFNENEMNKVYQTNVIGPAMMFKTYYKLLKQSKNARVINISSQLGSLNDAYNHCRYDNPKQKTATSYRLSKAALNMLTRCQAAQVGLKDNIIVLSFHPGHIITDMGTSFGKRKAVVEVIDACKAICKLVENMNMEQHNGSFYDWKNKSLSW